MKFEGITSTISLCGGGGINVILIPKKPTGKTQEFYLDPNVATLMFFATKGQQGISRCKQVPAVGWFSLGGEAYGWIGLPIMHLSDNFCYVPKLSVLNAAMEKNRNFKRILEYKFSDCQAEASLFP